MKEKTLKDKALMVIEILTSEGVAYDLEFDHALGRLKDKRLLELNKVLVDIYEYAHVARNPSCVGVHKNWVEKLENTYETMRKERFI